MSDSSFFETLNVGSNEEFQTISVNEYKRYMLNTKLKKINNE